MTSKTARETEDWTRPKYTAAELLGSVYGLGPRQFDRWRTAGALGPLKASPGSGIKLRYTEEDRAVYRMLVALNEAVRRLSGQGFLIRYTSDIGTFVRANLDSFRNPHCAVYVEVGLFSIDCSLTRPAFGNYLVVDVYP